MKQTSLLTVDTRAPPRAGLYRTIMADPPWLERGAGKIKRGADRHYPLMPTADIAALPVSEWAAADAHLYLWVTNNFLPDGLEVMRAWGFRYVTKIDWFKGELDGLATDDIEREVLAVLGDQVNSFVTADRAIAWSKHIAGELVKATTIEDFDGDLQVGLGQFFRGCTESCLFGVRGRTEYRLLPGGKRAQGRTGFHAPRGQHSAKPEKFRQVVERVSHGPYLEMFARRPAPGWDLWGNEVAE